MTLIAYREQRFNKSSELVIGRANDIIARYDAMNISLTLRQIYYQFVSQDWLPNNLKSYKRLGSILNDARMAGRVSWRSMEDRTRNLKGNPHWDSPADILNSAASGYREDLWADQDFYVEVWIEKDALTSVLEAVCPAEDVPYFSCRGYTSQSEMWAAAQRIGSKCSADDRKPVIIHLGDHDPSGIDMTRDVAERTGLFLSHDHGMDIDIRRIALNMNQVRKYNPPPNPAKMTDSRVGDYIKHFGKSSWELDALEPKTLIDLIKKEIATCRDPKRWKKAVERQEENRKAIREAANNI